MFAVIDPTPLSHDAEAHRLLSMAEQEKIPPPQLIESSPKDKVIMVFWLYRAGGDEKDGPEKLWWKTQCAIHNRLAALGFKISDTRPDPTIPISDKTVLYPPERGGVCEFYDLSDLAQRFGADELIYDAAAEKWIK